MTLTKGQIAAAKEFAIEVKSNRSEEAIVKTCAQHWKKLHPDTRRVVLDSLREMAEHGVDTRELLLTLCALDEGALHFPGGH